MLLAATLGNMYLCLNILGSAGNENFSQSNADYLELIQRNRLLKPKLPLFAFIDKLNHPLHHTPSPFSSHLTVYVTHKSKISNVN